MHSTNPVAGNAHAGNPHAGTVAAAHVVTPDGVLSPGIVEIGDDGTIAAVAPTSGPVPDRWLAPGFIDLQVNGHHDIDVSRADGADWERLDVLLAAQGVTTWCPTVVTAPVASYGPTLDRIGVAAARGGPRPTMAGVHLEGPFLGGNPGAHPRSLLRPLDDSWLDALPPIVRLVTLSPELEGAAGSIRRLVERGVVVSIGHSAATFEEALAAADAGATMVTHLFNGMPPLHHRSPGVVGAALTDPRLTAGLIADLVHVHPAALTVAFRAKGAARVALVTDAVAWRSARIGRIRIEHDGRAPRLPDGTLAGSALTMDRAVANVVEWCGIPVAAAVEAATATPARVLGLADRGALRPGLRADLVALRPDLTVEATWIGGIQVHG